MDTLYYGGNLKLLRDLIKNESVDQAPLLPEEGWHRFGDGVAGVPLFNSSRNYNVLFKDESGTEADSRDTCLQRHLGLASISGRNLSGIDKRTRSGQLLR